MDPSSQVEERKVRLIYGMSNISKSTIHLHCSSVEKYVIGESTVLRSHMSTVYRDHNVDISTGA
jgi:hypothetical protein